MEWPEAEVCLTCQIVHTEPSDGAVVDGRFGFESLALCQGFRSTSAEPLVRTAIRGLTFTPE